MAVTHKCRAIGDSYMSLLPLSINTQMSRDDMTTHYHTNTALCWRRKVSAWILVVINAVYPATVNCMS